MLDTYEGNEILLFIEKCSLSTICLLAGGMKIGFWMDDQVCDTVINSIPPRNLNN